jgi:hypothetical protein
MTDKQEFTLRVLTQLPAGHSWDINSAMTHWWKDVRPNSGLRLSTQGHEILQDLKIESWEFKMPSGTPARPQHLVVLNRCVTRPYYLNIGKNVNITFYGSKEATMFSLYGDIDRFVNALKTLN